MEQYNNGISPNPFDNLSEADLAILLEHNKDKLTEAQVLEIQARLNNFKISSDNELTHQQPQVQKVYTKTPLNYKKAGYVDIIVLMLTVWATCLCGMAYIYSQLNIMG